jgi:hypothetical protein
MAGGCTGSSTAPLAWAGEGSGNYCLNAFRTYRATGNESNGFALDFGLLPTHIAG